MWVVLARTFKTGPLKYIISFHEQTLKFVKILLKLMPGYFCRDHWNFTVCFLIVTCQNASIRSAPISEELSCIVSGQYYHIRTTYLWFYLNRKILNDHHSTFRLHRNYQIHDHIKQPGAAKAGTLIKYLKCCIEMSRSAPF